MLYVPDRDGIRWSGRVRSGCIGIASSPRPPPPAFGSSRDPPADPVPVGGAEVYFTNHNPPLDNRAWRLSIHTETEKPT